MAGLHITTTPPTRIDYSLVDGRVRSFELRGEVLFDEDAGTEVEGWKRRLADLVMEFGLADPSPLGCHAFIYWMIEQGLLTADDPQGNTSQ